MKIKDKDFSVESVGEKAVDNAKEITLLRIAEKEKTRRLLIIISAIMVLIAAAIMVFGPVERQGVNMIIGIVLLVFAMGSIGASQFVIKGGGFEVSTKEEKRQEEPVNTSIMENNDLEQLGDDRTMSR